MGVTLFAGTLVLPTLRSRAGPPLLFWTVRADLAASARVLTRLVGMLDVLLALPRMILPPVAPRAVVATPSTSASIKERPTMNTVALPTHTTFLTVLFTIILLLP